MRQDIQAIRKLKKQRVKNLLRMRTLKKTCNKYAAFMNENA